MKLIVTRPEHDVTTRYLSSWAEDIISFAKQKGVDVIDLLRAKANKQELEGRIKKVLPELIFLNGHGGDEYVTGHDNAALIHINENHELLGGRITYALSCNSGYMLGRKVVEIPRSAYIGYMDEFIFMADNSFIAKPTEDPKARPFKESSNQVMISLLKGHSPQEASERSKHIFNSHYTRMRASTADPDSLQAAQLLWWNMRNQVCLTG